MNDIVVLDFFWRRRNYSKSLSIILKRKIHYRRCLSPVSYRVIRERLNACKADYIDINPPLTASEWRLANGHYFADKVCMFMGWESNPKKSGDGGIDGWANNRKSAVQIKNSDVNVPTIRDLAGVCNGNYKHGSLWVGLFLKAVMNL